MIFLMNEYILAVFNIFLKIIKSQSCLQTESCERKQQAKKKTNKQVYKLTVIKTP